MFHRKPVISSSAEDSGAIAVEFALIAPLMLLILLVTIDFGRYFYVQMSLNSAAHEAARVGTMSEVSGTVIKNMAVTIAPKVPGLAKRGQTSSNLTVFACATTTTCSPTTLSLTSKYCDSAVTSDLLTVAVSTKFHWLTPLLSASEPTLTSRAVMMCSL